MSTTVTFNGQSFTIPAIGDASWGTNVGNYLIALASGSLQKTGGQFTLVNDVDFGSTYGLISKYFTTKSSTAATAGVFRLANADQVCWRNAANSANLALVPDGTDKLTFGGIQLADVSSTQTLTNKTIDFSSNTASNIPWASVLKVGSNLTDIVTRSHTSLTDIGTNTHAQIDTVLAALGATYAPIAKGVTNGDTHDHNGGDGAQIDHVNLANKGTNTHATIDSHIASTANPHSTTADQVLPSQTSNGGKFLTTNGTTSSWSDVPAGNLADINRNQKTLENINIACSVSGNALTITLKDSAGNDPTPGSPVKIGFRSSTLTNGTYLVRSVTAATSVVVSSGSTLGTTSAVAATLNVYAIDNAGTVELAVINGTVDENGLVTTVAEGGAGAADSASTLYSTTLRSSVPCRWIGNLSVTEATAGTWATAPSRVTVAPAWQAGAIPGIAASTVAAKGDVGEVISASTVRSSGISLQAITPLAVNIATITLTPGHWDVQACVGFRPTHANTFYRNLGVAISKTSATMPAADTFAVPTSGEVTVEQSSAQNILGSGYDITLTTPSIPVYVGAGTTQVLYAVLNAEYAGSSATATGYGSITAKRVR